MKRSDGFDVLVRRNKVLLHSSRNHLKNLRLWFWWSNWWLFSSFTLVLLKVKGALLSFQLYIAKQYIVK